MTSHELDAIEARAEAATPGPWLTTGAQAVAGAVAIWPDADPTGENVCVIGGTRPSKVRVPNDERFIAAAREDDAARGSTRSCHK